MHQYLYVMTFIVILILSVLAIIVMTKNNGQYLNDMADIFDSDIFEDLSCFNRCLETCMYERVPEISDMQKISCEQECGVTCAGDAPTFTF